MKLVSQFLSLTLCALLTSGQISAQTESSLQIKVIEDKSEKALAVQVSDAAGAPVGDAAVLFRMPESGPTATFADGTHAAVAYTDQSGRAAVSDLRWSQETGSSTVRITATRGTSRGGILFEHNSPVLSGAAAQAAVQATATAPPAPEQPKPTAMAAVVAAPASRSAQAQPQQPGIPEAKTLPVPQSTTEASMPKVSVSSTSPHEKIQSGGINKKWLILAIVAAGAGAGVAMAGKGKSGSSSSTTTGISIGTPTVSVGHP